MKPFDTRKQYGNRFIPPSNLLLVQKKSFEDFIQKNIEPQNRQNQGLQFLFKSFFPLKSLSGDITVDFVSYSIEEPANSPKKCRNKFLTYAGKIKATLRLTTYKDGVLQNIREQNIPFFTLPLMTEDGTFIVNGIEKVILSQIVRSPGVFVFKADDSDADDERFSATILPDYGAWLKFQFSDDDHLFATIDTSSPIKILTLLRAFGASDQEIIHNVDGVVIKSCDPNPEFEKHYVRYKGRNPNDVTSPLVLEARFDLLKKIKKYDVVPDIRTANLLFERLFRTPRRYHLSSTGRIKLNQKTGHSVPETEMLLSKEDLFGVLRHLLAIQRPDYDSWISMTFLRDGNALISLNNGRPYPLVTVLRAFGIADDDIIKHFPMIKIIESDPDPDFQALYDKYQKECPTDETTRAAHEARFKLLKSYKEENSQTIVKASQLFEKRFIKIIKSNLCKTGRVIPPADVNETDIVLSNQDLLVILQKIIVSKTSLKKDRGFTNSKLTDDIDSLDNKIVKTVGWQLVDYIRKGFNSMERDAMEAMLHPDLLTIMPAGIINSASLASVIGNFFNQNPLCQFAQQINPVAELSQKRRLSAIGVGGLDRDSASVESRDVQSTQYGRICPIESPEGKNIGIVSNLSNYSDVGEIGILTTPYRKVKKGVISDETIRLRPDEEKHYCLTDFNSLDESGLNLKTGYLPARRYDRETQLMETINVHYEDIDLIDISPVQILSPTTSLVPFSEHSDGHRALMGTSMQKQATPLIRTEAPTIGTGMERIIAMDLSYLLKAKYDGIVESVDGNRIIVNRWFDTSVVDVYKIKKENNTVQIGADNRGLSVAVRVGQNIREGDVVASCHKAVHNGIVELVNSKTIHIRRRILMGKLDYYTVDKYKPTNQGTSVNQKPCVVIGQHVEKDELLADCHSVSGGELALGKNMTVAYLSWNGFGYEDSVIISERINKEDLFTSVHVMSFSIDVFKTLLGNELVTKDLPGFSNIEEDIKSDKKTNRKNVLHALDENGIARVGSHVTTYDYLVGKVAPRDDEENMDGLEKLLLRLSGYSARKLKDESLIVPPGISGTVTQVQVLEHEKNKDEALTKELLQLRTERDNEFAIIKKAFVPLIDKVVGKHQDLLIKPDNSCFKGSVSKLSINGIYELDINLGTEAPSEVQNNTRQLLIDYREQIDGVKGLYKNKRSDSLAGDELHSGVIKRITITLIVKKKIEPGDKVAGRHGNKGIISRVLPVEEMPYMEDGTPIDIILNPLGVPSRMNIGQLLETQFGMACWTVGKKLNAMLAEGTPDMELKAFLKDIYDDSHRQQMIDDMDHNELSQIIFKLKDGVPIASSAFDGATEIDIQKMIAKAGLPPDGYFALRDGQTGDYFERKVMVGRQYIMKLYHLVSDKIHARAIGPYGAITQQPLKGRGKFGGQRLGEMEIWAIEAYGAAYNLLEMMTIKSDDVNGRNEAFESICTTGQYHMKEFGTMETTDVLLHELRGLALDIEKISREDADKEHARKKSINTKENKKGKKTNSLKKTKILLKNRLMKVWN